MMMMMMNLKVDVETVAPVEVVVRHQTRRQVVVVSWEKRWIEALFGGAATVTLRVCRRELVELTADREIGS